MTIEKKIYCPFCGNKGSLNKRTSVTYIEDVILELFKCSKDSDKDVMLKKKLDIAIDTHREAFGE